MKSAQLKNVQMQGNIYEDGPYPSSRTNDQTNMTCAFKNSSQNINHNIKQGEPIKIRDDSFDIIHNN